MKQLNALLILMLICGIGIPLTVYGESIGLTTTIIGGSEPLYMIDESSGSPVATGLSPEIMTAFARTAPEFDFKYETKFIPWARVKDYLKQNKIQVQFGIARNADREKIYQYTDIPLYPVLFSFAVRKEDSEIHNIKTFEEMKRSGGTVLGIRETGAVKAFLERTKDLNIPVELTSTNEQNLKKLIHGRGRYVLYHHYALIDGAKKLGFADKIVLLPLVLKETHHWLAFSNAVPQEVVQKANAVLRKMQESGELKSIYEKYGKLP